MSIAGPTFVLIIIGMAMFAGVAKAWIRARHGLPDREPRRRHRSRLHGEPIDSEEVITLKAENRRLTDRLEASEDRLAVLERIVTDKGYGLAEEIEALRDRPSAIHNTSGVPLDLPRKEEV